MDLTLTHKQAKFYCTLFDVKTKKLQETHYKEFYFMGGFGSGKSRIIITATDQICRMYPGSHGVFIRNTYPELKDSVIPQFHAYLQFDGYVYNKSDRICEYSNGTRLDFRAFDEPQKILSNEYDFMVFSQIEEIQQELFLLTLGRNRRRLGGLPRNIILGEGNPDQNWIKERLVTNKPDSVYVINSVTSDNPNLPDDYEKNLRANYPDWWVARFVDGSWIGNLAELVFSEFRPEKHVISPIDPNTIPKSYKRLNAMDYGWVNPTAILFAFVDYDSNITIYDEWYGDHKIPEEIAKEGLRYGKLNTVADHAMKGIHLPNDQDRSKTIWTELTRFGMNLIICNKEELSNIIFTNTLFKAGRLKVTSNCVNFIREASNWKWKKLKLGSDKNPEEIPTDKDNHGCDTVNYLCAYLKDEISIDPKVLREKDSLRSKVIEIDEPDLSERG